MLTLQRACLQTTRVTAVDDGTWDVAGDLTTTTDVGGLLVGKKIKIELSIEVIRAS